MEKKETTNQYADEKKWNVSFDLKAESEEEWLTGRKKRVPDHIFGPKKKTKKKKPLSPRVLLLSRGTPKIRVSETERREQAVEERWSNSVRYGEAVSKIMLKQVWASLRWVHILCIYQRRAKKKKKKRKKFACDVFVLLTHSNYAGIISDVTATDCCKMAALMVILYFELHHSYP